MYNQRSVETLLNNHIMVQLEGQPSLSTREKYIITLILERDPFYFKCGETSKPLHKNEVES